eukprot:TRINITY_DN24172_c0_g1_i1.p1 TRINITY_DN24172_c0_g1~~TRINITY_DN24172_c0_g1_i1.p1  ORF type:complete len:670 (+),score=97.10 TRINITY_DN24172_c0_g1_i1:91-2010(+)
MAEARNKPAPGSAPSRTYRYVDRGGERTAEFPIDPKEDVSGVIASASSRPLRDYQDKLKAIQMRERGLSKIDIAEKLNRSEHWVKRWWREQPALLERPAGVNDVVLRKASLNSFRDLDVRRDFAEDSSVYDAMVQQVKWRQAKVVARDQNTGELAPRYDERGSTINAGRQVADYSGGLDFIDKLLQKVFYKMDIRDPQARVFMNYYADGQDRTGVHRHDFWTCLLSFGSPRILTVDNRPILLRDGDLIVFGTQNHGVPIMPEISGGRISLVIFFYPDADNLERQWQTVTEDGNDESRGTTDAQPVHVGLGLDQGFKTSILMGELMNKAHGTAHSCDNDCSGIAQAESVVSSVLESVLDPGTERRSLLKSPNSELKYQAADTSGDGPCIVFSVSCDERASDATRAERDLFHLLRKYGVAALWDFRCRPPREGWCCVEVLRRRCAAQNMKYRSYPLGRREAGGARSHVQSEEGRDYLQRMTTMGRQEPVAYLTSDADWHNTDSLRAAVADALLDGKHGNEAAASSMRVLHLSQSGAEEQDLVQKSFQEAVATERGAADSRASKDHAKTTQAPPDKPDGGTLPAAVSAETPATGKRWGITSKVAMGAGIDDIPLESGYADVSEEATALPKKTGRWGRRGGTA